MHVPSWGWHYRCSYTECVCQLVSLLPCSFNQKHKYTLHLILHCLTVVYVLFRSLKKELTPKIRMLCFVITNSVLYHILCVWKLTEHFTFHVFGNWQNILCVWILLPKQLFSLVLDVSSESPQNLYLCGSADIDTSDLFSTVVHSHCCDAQLQTPSTGLQHPSFNLWRKVPESDARSVAQFVCDTYT